MDEVIPLQFFLSQNYPNPFKEKTTIKYCVAYRTRVQITVYGAEGTMIEKLVDEVKEAGTYEVEFSVCVDNSGIVRKLTKGSYYYSLEAGEYRSEKKMLLLK